MSLSAILKDPKAADERLTGFPASKEDVEGGLSALSYADGVITAVIVGPEPIPVSEWMPLIVDISDESLSDEETQLAIGALGFAHSKIVKTLKSRAKDYEPFFWVDRDERLVTQDWAEGFLAGMRLRQAAWEPLRMYEAKMLTGLLSALLQDEKIDAKMVEMGLDPEEIFDIALEALPDLIQALYGIRKEQALDSGMVRHLEKTGRNDPCPCGSGRKYKKCCLN
jgi:uncharacterized protein